MVDHTIVHFDIPAEDIEKLRSFYSDLFRWMIEKVPGPIDYWLIETVPVDEKGMPLRPGVNGGMVKRDTRDQTQMNYISVEAIDEYVEKIKKLGGEITIPKHKIEGVGWMAQALDPEGNPFAIIQTIM